MKTALEWAGQFAAEMTAILESGGDNGALAGRLLRIIRLIQDDARAEPLAAEAAAYENAEIMVRDAVAAEVAVAQAAIADRDAKLLETLMAKDAQRGDAVAEEREACALAAEDRCECGFAAGRSPLFKCIACNVADAIRARGAAWCERVEARR